MKRKAFLIFLLIGALLMIVMSVRYFQFDDVGVLKNKDVSGEIWYVTTLRIHIFLGLVAISIGPLQFVKRIRNLYGKFHKGLGYLYFTSIVLSSLSGLIVAKFAMGGLITQVGFSVLASLWLLVTMIAVLAAKNGKIQRHRKWMFLSYGLTFSAVTQRTLLLSVFITDVGFMVIYQISAWLPWILNLSIAYFLYRRSVRLNT